MTEVRAALGPGRLVGLSVESTEDLAAALRLPEGTLDLVGLSPVWATPTKPEAGPGLGLAAVRELAATARAAGLTAVAIGGIDRARAPELAHAGVVGVAVVSALSRASDPAAEATAILQVWKHAVT